MSGSDPIPAVREEDATGETAAIFADLRRTLGVPFVNLIWRHLATIPDALPSTWTTVKPLYGTVELAEAAKAVAGLVSFPSLPPVPSYGWDALALGAGERNTIAVLIADYNRANGVNFLAMLVAQAVLGGEAAPGGSAGSPGRPGPRQESVSIPLPGLDALPPPVLCLVRDLDGFGRLGASDAIASLYRHLAHWPAFLAVARTALEPLHRSGELALTQQRVIAAGRERAVGLARLASPDARRLGPEPAALALGSIGEFTRLMIGRMIVMGAALARLLEPEDA